MDIDTSNLVKLEKYIENKINQIFDVLPPNPDIKIPKMIYEYTTYELYQGTIQTAVDIINDLSILNAERKYMQNKQITERLLQIFFSNERKLFVGIMLVILSFILYFIDGAST